MKYSELKEDDHLYYVEDWGGMLISSKIVTQKELNYVRLVNHLGEEEFRHPIEDIPEEMFLTLEEAQVYMIILLHDRHVSEIEKNKRNIEMLEEEIEQLFKKNEKLIRKHPEYFI